MRFGNDALPTEKRKKAINLLRKYKPIINLGHYKNVADQLDKEASQHSRTKSGMNNLRGS